MIKMRVRYSKEEEACLLSHHEVQAALVRWLRRSNLPLVYSEGFNQRVRIETGIPTGVGMVSLQEYVDVLLDVWSPVADRANALERTAFMAERENSKSHAPKDIRKYVLTAQISTRTPLRAHVGVFFDQSGTIRMNEVITYIFGLDAKVAPMPVITRQSVLLNMSGAFVDPMDAVAQAVPPHRPKGNHHDSDTTTRAPQ
jgi:hypothetical protein